MAIVEKMQKNTETDKKSTKKKADPATKKVPSNDGFAVIETGGKQYRVSVGDSIKIEKIKADSAKGSVEPKEGDKLIFDKVLLVDNGADVTDVGTPYLEGAKVSGTIVEIGRSKKVTVIKYKQKSRYFKKNGHRQPYFKVKIEKIS